MNQSPIVVFDADPAVYQAGFSAQSSNYTAVYEKKSGELVTRAWGDGRKMRAFFRRWKQLNVLSIDKDVVAKPVEFARQAAATVIRATLRRVSERFNVSPAAITTEVYLSGQGNFRDKVATILPYKGNRTQEPPIHYQAVRNYFYETWGAQICTGEADDAVSIRCRQLRSDGLPFVLATIDKDLDQAPGLHYGYKEHVFYDVTADEAEDAFWRQALSGDITDNIQGLVKVGPAKAQVYVSAWREQECSDTVIWSDIVGLYGDNMRDYPDKYPPGMTAEAAALETARLVYMQRYEGEIWTPPT